MNITRPARITTHGLRVDAPLPPIEGKIALEPAERIDVTIVDDDPSHLELIAQMLQRAGFKLSLAGTMQEGIERINQDRPKVVVCDYDLPDGDGVQLFHAIHKNPDLASTYCILISANSCSELAARALEAWADDYLPKPVIERELVARIRVGIRIWSMHDRLHRAAITDGLTGLFNHDHFHNVLETEMARSRRYGHPLALVLLDLDYFKVINDTYGHLTGNAVLEQVARVLSHCVRDVDTVGRVGGEEFAVLLPVARTTDAVQVAERIRAELPTSVSIGPAPTHEVTASFGIADSEDPRATSATELLDLADRALYAAKHAGRNRYAVACDLGESADVEAAIETDEVDWLRRRLAVLNARIRDVYVQSVATLLKALDEKDPYAARHSVNVAFYAERIAAELNCSRATRKSVYNAALLHDIGKVGVPDSILMKRTPLTPLETMVLEQVPLIGTRIVDHMRILEAEIQIIRHQREHFDGTGTPAGLHGEQIPIGARILMAADAFDSMTTDRVYRSRRPIEDTLIEIQRLGDKQFDPAVASALQRAFVRDREEWEQRIEETIRASRVPTDREIGLAAGSFVPSAD